MLRGLTTVNIWADDLEAARHWYSELLGIDAYFNVQNPDGSLGYTEFRIGDYQHELGLLDSRYLPDLGGEQPGATGPNGVIVYWHVDDVAATLERLVALGATLHQPPRDFGEGFVGASAIDPFGNILGIMGNPHYLEVLSTLKPD